MSLDLNTPRSSGHHSVCGVLTCEESFTLDTPDVTTRSTSHHRSISSMRLFQTSQAKLTNVRSNADDKRMIAELNVDRPRIARVSDGVKVDGVLEAERAALRLELVKEIDCQALYLCEVKTSDGQGNEFVHTNRLHQESKTHKNQTDGVVEAPGVLSQEMAFLQQHMSYIGSSLEGKLVALESHLDGKLVALQARLDAIESRSEVKIDAMGKEMGDKMESFDRKFAELESHNDGNQNRLEDKIETRVVDKLCQLEMKLPSIVEMKLPSIEDDGHANAQILDKITISMKSYKEQIKHENERALRQNGLIFSNLTSNIVSTIQGHMDALLKLEQRNQLSFNTLMSANDKLTKSSLELSHQFQDDFSVLQNNLHMDFDHLKSGVQNSSSETLSAVRDLISDTNSTMWSSPKPVVFEIMIAKECKRGRYHVIQPKESSEVDAHYLCDSVTGGGGWIVIQRRVSGDVNFYRSWAEYREGFGSLNGDFWWGNEKIHSLTSSGRYELRVELKYKEKSSFADYSSFSLDGENDNYTLRLGTYDGTAGDSLSYHNGKPFSTFDRDNDGLRFNRAVTYSGAWWFYNKNCNLNGKWNTVKSSKAANWITFSGMDSVSFSEMKIRKI